MQRSEPPPGRTPFGLPASLAFVGLLAIAGFFLWTEHKAHLLGAVPYVLVVLALLVPVLMYRKHDDGRGGGRDRKLPRDGGTEDSG